MVNDIIFTNEFIKGGITCLFAGIGGLLVILIKHSVQLGVIKNQIETLNKNFEKIEKFFYSDN